MSYRVVVQGGAPYFSRCNILSETFLKLRCECCGVADDCTSSVALAAGVSAGAQGKKIPVPAFVFPYLKLL